MKDQGWLQGIAQVRGEQQQWLAWFEQALPEELRGAIVNVVRKKTELTVLAASAAWSARLRYALEALGVQIRERAPGIVKVRVRVMPSGKAPRSSA